MTPSQAYTMIAEWTGVSATIVRAIAIVESSEREQAQRFEPHVFKRRTKEAFAAAEAQLQTLLRNKRTWDPDVYPLLLERAREVAWSWERAYRLYDDDQGLNQWWRNHLGTSIHTHEGQLKIQEYTDGLDLEASAASASYGMFQIMGFNHNRCGFASPVAFRAAMKKDLSAQAGAFARFVKSSAALQNYMQRGEIDGIAFHYNGSAYKKWKYDTKLRAAIARAEVEKAYA